MYDEILPNKIEHEPGGQDPLVSALRQVIDNSLVVVFHAEKLNNIPTVYNRIETF